MQTETRAWRHLNAYAASRLPARFPDRVLRAARLSANAGEDSPARRFFLHPFAVSAYTAALCAALVIVIHAQNTESENARHLADWQEVAMQTASLDPL